MNWKSVDKNLPPEGKLVLLAFEKNNPTRWGKTGTFIVEGYFKVSEAYSWEGEHPGNKMEWFDYTGRLLCKIGGKTTTNKVTHWTESYDLPVKLS